MQRKWVHLSVDLPREIDRSLVCEREHGVAFLPRWIQPRYQYCQFSRLFVPLLKVVLRQQIRFNSYLLQTRKPSYRWRESLPKLLQFDVPTTLSLTILAYLHAFNFYCVRNPWNPVKFTENSNLWSSRSSKVIDLGANRKPICDLLLVTNSNFSRICYRFRDIHG